ncbi:uncharacterized protein [Drosophila tropicalis]|uniref:uncharacterized protein n=1 Tax=Drosophila tropicalis TaxID=46794 RepID=UPI0035AB6DC2
MFFNPYATYGQRSLIFLTMPHLGNNSFILNITVNTRDYLIDVKVTNPNVKANGWRYTQKLDSLLRRNGIRVPSVPDQLLAPKCDGEVLVRLTRTMTCEPKMSLRFCGDPERPVEIAPRSHLAFMAEVTSKCTDLGYPFVNWSIYDITNKNLLGRVSKTKNLVLKLLPYKLHFIHHTKTNRDLVLQVHTHILGSLIGARCYLRYLPPLVEPIIVGNKKRLVNVHGEIVLNGSLSRDLSKPENSGIAGQLEWDCESVDDPKNPFCHHKMSNNAILTIPARKLQIGSQYDYKLTMTSALDGSVRNTTQQSVRGVDYETFTPHIHCCRNCELGLFARNNSINLKAMCYDCRGFMPRFEWWVSIGGEEHKLLSKLNHLVVFHDVDYLAINLKMFQPNGLVSETERILKQNTGPKDGQCTIFPEIGVEAKTIFTIDCRGYQTDYPPLLYRYMIDMGVIDSNVPYERYQLPLPATNALYISICDALDMCNEFHVDVHVQPLNVLPISMFRGNERLMTDRQLRGLLIHVPDMLSQGQWNRAFVRSLVSTKQIRSSYDGTLVYSYLVNEELITSVQLEQLTVLAMNMLSHLTPVNYRGAALMATVFAKLSEVFRITIVDLDWLHQDGYSSMTAMYVFFLSVLSTASERHPRAMCRVEEHCFTNKRIHEDTLPYDQLTALRINYWLKCTWYLYKCVYYLGFLASKRHFPHDDTYSVHKGGISYQVNVTGVDSSVADLTIEIAEQQITLSRNLLNELKYTLQHNTLLFQIISQTTNHNMYWWYPETFSSVSHVLIVHAFSPAKLVPSGEEFLIQNPLVFSMNTSEVSKDSDFFDWMINGSMTSDSHIHYYKVTLQKRNLLSVRIINCSDKMKIALNLHYKPKFKEIRRKACEITPQMNGRRIWMLNFCKKQAQAFVSVISGINYRTLTKTKSGWHYDKQSKTKKRVLERRLIPLNYSILLETYRCSYWKNRTLNPGWSTDYCLTEFDDTLIKCTCDILGPLSTRIFPIAAQRHLDVIVMPILEPNWYMLLIFLILFVTLFLVLATYMRGISAYQRHSMLRCNVQKEKVITENLQLTLNEELLVMVVTGGQTFAGTTSNVILYFKSVGRDQVTYHIQQDPMSPRLTRNSTIKLTLDRGPIVIPTRLAFGIDRNGRYPSWYCRSVTIVDLERHVQQFFVVNRWIEGGTTNFLRSPYYTHGRMREPPFAWCQRFCYRLQEIFINWYMVKPIVGPWLTSTNPNALNRFERSCVFLCKLSITIALANISFGRSSKRRIIDDYSSLS